MFGYRLGEIENRINPIIKSNKGDGSVIAVDSVKQQEQPFQFTHNQPNEILSLAANDSQTVIGKLSGEGPCEFFYLSRKNTGAARVSIAIEDGLELRDLMNKPVHINTIAGNGNQPYRFEEALHIHELRGMTFTYYDISGSTNNVQLLFSGKRYLNQIFDKRLQRIKKRIEINERLSYPYFYTFDGVVPVISAAATQIEEITIKNDAHFLLTHISGTSTAPYNLNLIDGNTNQSIIDAPNGLSYRISSDLLVGTGAFPYRFEQGIFFSAGSKIIIDMQNPSAGDNTIFLTLGGIWLTKEKWRKN